MSKQLVIFSGSVRAKTHKVQTYEGLCKQIKALEFALTKAFEQGKPVFAFNGKLKKLNKQLDDFNWLAK